MSKFEISILKLTFFINKNFRVIFTLTARPPSPLLNGPLNLLLDLLLLQTSDKLSLQAHLCVLSWCLRLPQLHRADRNIKIKLCSAKKFTATSYSLRIYNKILLISIFFTKVKFLTDLRWTPSPLNGPIPLTVTKIICR